jgi:hypothetical protein
MTQQQDPLTTAIRRLDADLAQVDATRDDHERAQLRAAAEERYLQAAHRALGHGG